MSIKGKAYIAGIYEHPTRKATDLSVAQLHGEVAAGAIADAGISKEDIGQKAWRRERNHATTVLRRMCRSSSYTVRLS